MPKAQYIIAGFPFPTQKAVFDYAKAIKNAHIDDVVITDPAAIAFLSDLLRHHPRYDEKMANGLQGFCVKPNVGGSGHALCIVPESGDIEEFKPKKCLAKDNAYTNIFDACRRSIADQLRSARKHSNRKTKSVARCMARS